MFEMKLEEELLNTAGVHLKVVGVGGAGGNAVNSMMASGEMESVVFIVANTDAQALTQSPAHYKVQLGKKITKGLGAGSNPEIGRRAAEEDLDAIKELLKDTDILFLTAGLGGGTGTGALPVIAQLAKELGILTVGVVTKPFTFEGKRRAKLAEEALLNVKKAVDTLITVPNQKLLEIADPKISMLNAFALSNNILRQAIKGISDIITKAGHINVDFADVRTIMKDTGHAIMGTGRASGPDRARQAALLAISSPLLESGSIAGARGVLINITGNADLELQEINDAASMIYDMVNPEANIILGSVVDTTMGDEISVTVIATGLDELAQKTVAQVTMAAAYSAPLAPSYSSPASPAPQLEPLHVPVEQPVTEERVGPATSFTQEQAAPAAHTAPIEESFALDSLDTPTFMRKKFEHQVQAHTHEEK